MQSSSLVSWLSSDLSSFPGKAGTLLNCYWFLRTVVSPCNFGPGLMCVRADGNFCFNSWLVQSAGTCFIGGEWVCYRGIPGTMSCFKHPFVLWTNCLLGACWVPVPVVVLGTQQRTRHTSTCVCILCAIAHTHTHTQALLLRFWIYWGKRKR